MEIALVIYGVSWIILLLVFLYAKFKSDNSIEKEPNLLLEIDHIIPIAKNGMTTEENLQTLCWKCNRSKGSKIEE